MNALIEALRAGITPDQVSKDYDVAVKPHPEFPEILMFKYNQISSPMDNPIVQCCRGIMLDSKNDWKPVSWTFSKFFNLGEPNAAQIDWNTARVYEKLDGSLMQMAYYGGQYDVIREHRFEPTLGRWRVATSGTPDAVCYSDDTGRSFRDLFWEAMVQSWKNPTGENVPKNWCLAWELMTPWNRVVVPHKTERVVLIGVRDLNTGKELHLDDPEVARFQFPTVRSFPITDLEGIQASMATFKGLDQEGYVVCDANFNRVKIKHPEYVALHHMKGDDGPTYKKMLRFVQNGEGEEILAYWPEWRPMYDKVAVAYTKAVEEIKADYYRISDLALEQFSDPSVTKAALQKFFASHAKQTRCPDALFRLRAGKVDSVRDYLAECSPDAVLAILGLK